MESSKRFKPIQKLAEKKERDAASAFGKTLRDQDAAQKQLDDLRQYRQEYESNFSSMMRNGMGGNQLHEYQAFIAHLDKAIEQQKQILAQLKDVCSESKEAWQNTYTRSRAMGSVVERLEEEEVREQERQEQKLADDRFPRDQE